MSTFLSVKPLYEEGVAKKAIARRKPACPGAPEPCCRRRLGNFAGTLNVAPGPTDLRANPPGVACGEAEGVVHGDPASQTGTSARSCDARVRDLSGTGDSPPSATPRLPATYPDARNRVHGSTQPAHPPCPGSIDTPRANLHGPATISNIVVLSNTSYAG